MEPSARCLATRQPKLQAPSPQLPSSATTCSPARRPRCSAASAAGGKHSQITRRAAGGHLRLSGRDWIVPAAAGRHEMGLCLSQLRPPDRDRWQPDVMDCTARRLGCRQLWVRVLWQWAVLQPNAGRGFLLAAAAFETELRLRAHRRAWSQECCKPDACLAGLNAR